MILYFHKENTVMNILELKKAIKNLSYSDRREILAMLEQASSSTEIVSSLEEAKFADGIYCPSCGCAEDIIKFGKKNGTQRYRCKNCGRIFNAMARTVFEGTKKSLIVWEKYIECMLDGLSLRKTARACSISVRTAFMWRHKILDALSQKHERETRLRGVIEADETFFRISYKGSRHLPAGRRPHKRGMKASQRGLSRQQVCVPCAMDRADSVLSKVCNLGKICTDDLVAFYREKVESGAIFCTDSESSYKKFAELNEYKLHQIPSGKHKNGIYHINHVNAYHSRMKMFISNFRGVATKYLNNYIVWNNCIKMGIQEVMESAVKVICVSGYDTLPDRPALPLIAA